MAGNPRRTVVFGASGNVGACVTRHLCQRGDDVRVLLRKLSSTRGIDNLPIQAHYGDIFDTDAVAAAMADRDDVYYCVVDTRAELRDPAPLFRTNVQGLRNVLDVATDSTIRRFVYLSTIGTVAVGANGETVDEETPFNWADEGGAYIAARRQGEDMVLKYARENGLPTIAMCVSNPYGPPDWVPRQGALVELAAKGRLPCYVGGAGSEVVGIDDVAEAMLLAADRGRIGQRYIISERYMTQQELVAIAADAVGVRAPRFAIPMAALRVIGHIVDFASWITRRDMAFNSGNIRLIERTSPADHSKAARELGWRPGPTADFIRRAAQFYVDRDN